MALDLNDSHGSNHLTGSGSPTAVLGAGDTGSAMRCLAASSQYAFIADNADLSFGDEDFTIVGLIKFTVAPGVIGLCGKWPAEYQLYVGESAANRLSISISNGVGDPSVRATANNYGNIPADTWLMFAAVHDAAADEVRININAGTQDVEAYADGCSDGTAQFRVNNDQSGNIPSCDWDHLRVWGAALSAANINTLYNGGSYRAYGDLAGLGLTSGLLAAWEFGGYAASTASRRRRLSLLGAA